MVAGGVCGTFRKIPNLGYRQIYAGKVKAITEHGRILIPAAEVENILKTAGVYDGLKPKPTKKAELQAMAPKLQNAWASFIAKCREVGAQPHISRASAQSKWPENSSGRDAALSRMKRVGPPDQ